MKKRRKRQPVGQLCAFPTFLIRNAQMTDPSLQFCNLLARRRRLLRELEVRAARRIRSFTQLHGLLEQAHTRLARSQMLLERPVCRAGLQPRPQPFDRDSVERPIPGATRSREALSD